MPSHISCPYNQGPESTGFWSFDHFHYIWDPHICCTCGSRLINWPQKCDLYVRISNFTHHIIPVRSTCPIWRTLSIFWLKSQIIPSPARFVVGEICMTQLQPPTPDAHPLEVTILHHSVLKYTCCVWVLYFQYHIAHWCEYSAFTSACSFQCCPHELD